MKKWSFVFTMLTIAILAVSACSPAPAAAPIETAPVEAAPAEKAQSESTIKAEWTQDYITQVPPIMMKDPYLIMFGQTEGAIPYTYEEAVKLSGHSCGATAGAFTITRKALEVLYPDGETPVRGQIRVLAPGAEDQWYIGVFGEIITYITGAAPKTGFIGAEFGEVNDVFVRRNKMIYTEEPTETQPPMMKWIFERIDTGKKVSVQFNLAVITPIATPERTAMGKKMALGQATPEEAADYIKYWNDRARFVLENADTLDGFFVVTVVE